MSNVNRGALEKGLGGIRGALDRAFYGKNTKERFLTLSLAGVYLFLGVFFSKATVPYTEMSVGRPLADALVSSAGKWTPFAFVGAIYGLVSTEGVTALHVFPLTVTLVLRILVSLFISYGRGERGSFNEPILLKTGIASFSALVQCGVFMLTEAAEDGEWNRIIATVIALPVMTAVFSFFFSGYPERRITGVTVIERAAYEISELIFFSTTVYSIGETRYFGVSLAALTAIVLVLICAERGGAVRGAVSGAVLGYTVAPSLMLSFAAVGGVAGMLYFASVPAAAGISAAAGSLVAFWQTGYLSLLNFVPETVIAVAIASPVIRYSFIPEGFPYPKNELPTELKGLAEAELRAVRSADECRYLTDISEALKGVSGAVAEREITDAPSGAKKVADMLRDGFCESCPLSSICWETEWERSVVSVREITEDSGKNTYLSGYCVRFKELRREIERISGGGVAEKSETTALNTVTAADLSFFAELLSDTVSSVRAESERDAEAEEKLFSALSRAGVKAKEISVLGRDRKKVYLYGAQECADGEGGERIRRLFSETLRTEYGAPRPVEGIEGGYVLSPEKTVSVRVHCVKASKEGERVSGDSVLFGELSDGVFYAMLSDGMGSGEEAAAVSELALSMLEKLVKGGVGLSRAAGFVGELIRRRGRECFTTLDLLKVDLINGNASVIKNGAVASYAVRGGGLYCIDRCSMPVGITEGAASSETVLKLSEGDSVIMVSDGIASDGQEGKWIGEIALGGLYSGRALAERIMKTAEEKRGCNDDRTVLVLEIEEYSSVRSSE